MKPEESKKVPLIFDTDMDVDCDDAGALAVLHALMDYGEVEILGVIVDVPLEVSARCVIAINSYYNRVHIPVGLVQDNDFEKGNSYQLYRETKQKISNFRNPYTKKVVEQFSSESIKTQKISDAVSLYRRLLSEAENYSVVITAVGLLTALKHLLESKPDEISQLNGRELVQKKVNKLVTMGIGRFPEAKAEFNWLLDWESAQHVINHWPTPLVVQSNGTEFLTGNTLSIKTPESNPVRKCYEVYLGRPRKGNFSWDPLAALYGVRGSEPYLYEKQGYRLILEPELGINHWVVNDGNIIYRHSFLQLKSPKIKLKKALEDLIIKPPKNRS
ncbi:hypothetical protein LCGC14_1147080 [marine sediment metagenome]|uniref:Inosine/uridine-preferring nucleoside hydrolase domain-containing protein n=1 Tax=marine sediment metagenome TaxID=412755 RepID=A0A0F9MJT4_9ZZZZ